MHFLQTWRKKLGISQQNMAAYLEISYSLLAMVETGRRSLPTRALLKYNSLEEQFTKAMNLKKIPLAADQPDQGTRQLEARLKKEMQYKVKECNYKSILLQRKLTKLEDTYKSGQAWIYVVNELLQRMPAGKETQGDRSWLESQRNKMAKKMQHCGPVQQGMLATRIRVLTMKAEAHDKMLKYFK